MILEIIAFTIDSCKKIETAGAQRIELCDNPGEGGTTPSYGMIKAAREAASIELYPIIRPRGGDFLYSDEEFAIIKNDIRVCRELGCDGVVTGILETNGSIDKKRTAQLVQLAYPMGLTFHRAFDRVKDASQALEDLIDIGCERVLTSGLYPTAEQGAAQLKALVEQAAGRIIIMPGSGIRATNIAAIATATGATEFHSSARIIKDSAMEFSPVTMNEKLQSVTVDEDEIRRILMNLEAVDNLP
ncbi:MAG: copper homeostasis protein CutC [Ferruginibacter sp.]|nr:copper homeostasis protein CutC [Ferruginibacter sp.]